MPIPNDENKIHTISKHLIRMSPTDLREEYGEEGAINDPTSDSENVKDT